MNSKYPFTEMGVGESVFYEGQDEKGAAFAAARSHAYRSGKRFMAANDVNGVRIWRVSVPDGPKSETGRPQSRSHSQYPFKWMDIGESAFYEGQGGTGKAANAARAHAKRSGKKFKARCEGRGVRIWRIE